MVGVWLPWACVAPPPLTSDSDAQNTLQNVVLHSHAQEGLQPRGRGRGGGGGEEEEGEGREVEEEGEGEGEWTCWASHLAATI